jgi:hypothetical protein
MSKIYIDPLNLGPILIDRNDKSDHEPDAPGTAWNYGIPCDEVTKQKIRETQIGKTHSVETKEKMSQSQFKRSAESYDGHRKTITGTGNHFYGKKHSPETLYRMRESQKLRRHREKV